MHVRQSHQRKSNDSDPPQFNSAEVQALEYVQQNEGQPLDAAARDQVTPLAGHDFGKIRIFSDSQAANMANGIGARAYTVDQNIVFNQGEFDPTSTDGRFVLAHELAHTIQNQKSVGSKNQSINPSNDASETEANTFAAGVSLGMPTAIQAAPAAAISRFPSSEPVPQVIQPQAPLGAGGSSSPAAISDPWAAAAPHDLSFKLGKHSFSNLDAQTATSTLAKYREALKSDVSDDKRIHRELRDNREQHSIVGFWSDTLGGASLPDYERWDDIESTLFEAKLAIGHNPVDEQHIHKAEAALNQSDAAIDKMIVDLGHYSKDSVKGAERAVSGLEKVRDTSKMAVDIASGGKLGGLYGGAQQLAQQTSEVVYGQRDSIDLKSIAVNVAVDYISGKIGGKIGAGKAVGKMFGTGAAGTIAGKVVGEVVDQKVNSAVGIATNAAVSNAVGLEGAPSLGETGANILNDLTSIDPEEMLKNYALGKAVSGTIEAHKKHYEPKSHTGNHANPAHQEAVPSPKEVPQPSATLETAVQPQSKGNQESTPASAKGDPQLSPENLALQFAAIQASMAHANQVNTALERQKSKAPSPESASHTPALEPQKPAEALHNPVSDQASQPASSKSESSSSTLISETSDQHKTPSAPLTLNEPTINPNEPKPKYSVKQPGGTPPSDFEESEATTVKKNPLSKGSPFDDEPTVVKAKDGTRKYTDKELHDTDLADHKYAIQAVTEEMYAKYGEQLDHFESLPRVKKREIILFQNERLNHHFTADHEGKGRAKAPTVIFKDQPKNTNWLGQSHGPLNRITLNTAAPANAKFTDWFEEGLGSTHVHEFAHIHQHRQAQNPEGFLVPKRGYEMAENDKNYHPPGKTKEESQLYENQASERNARFWSQRYNVELARSRKEAQNPNKPPHQPVPGDSSKLEKPLRTIPPEEWFDPKTMPSDHPGATPLEPWVSREPNAPLSSGDLNDAVAPIKTQSPHEDWFDPSLMPSEHPGATPLDVWSDSPSHLSDALTSQLPPGSGTSLPPKLTTQVGDNISNTVSSVREVLGGMFESQVQNPPTPKPKSPDETGVVVKQPLGTDNSLSPLEHEEFKRQVDDYVEQSGVSNAPVSVEQPDPDDKFARGNQVPNTRRSKK